MKWIKMKKRCLWALLIINISIITACGKTDKIKLEGNKKDYQSYEAKSSTQTVGGLIAYNKNSDMILDIPEEYFLNLDENMTWDKLIAEIGEPSGTIGSGIVRDYWRIGEDKYAVLWLGGEVIKFEICGK